MYNEILANEYIKTPFKNLGFYFLLLLVIVLTLHPTFFFKGKTIIISHVISEKDTFHGNTG